MVGDSDSAPNEDDPCTDEPTRSSDLIAGKVSVTRTQRGRYFWAAWWTNDPERIPFRKPDASNGGASSTEAALRDAERSSGRVLSAIDPLWARGWNRVLRGLAPFSDAEVRRLEGNAPPPRAETRAESMWTILGVSPHATRSEIKLAFRKRALATHPDQGGDADEFRRVEEAYRRALARRDSAPRSGRAGPRRRSEQ